MFKRVLGHGSPRATTTRRLLVALALLTLLMANTAQCAGRAAAPVAPAAPASAACTHGPAYWQSHPDDPAWAAVGADAPFFGSGLTWRAALAAPVPPGDVYYRLARQYIATRLNLAAGAEPHRALEWALVWADRYFENKTPASALIKPDYEMGMQNIAIFERYNTGVIGPGSCGE